MGIDTPVAVELVPASAVVSDSTNFIGTRAHKGAHVRRSELRIGGQDQCADPRGQRTSRGGAAKIKRVVSIIITIESGAIRSDDFVPAAAARSQKIQPRAILAVVAAKIAVGGSSDGD